MKKIEDTDQTVGEIILTSKPELFEDVVFNWPIGDSHLEVMRTLDEGNSFVELKSVFVA